MTNLVQRQGAPGSRPGVADWLGWDPFRNFFTGVGQVAGIDVVRDQSGTYRVEIPVAGYKPEQIEITLEDDVLTVTGSSETRQFRRSLLLPDEIDGDNIQANVEHGLLTLTLNVHPKAQPKKIAISTGSAQGAQGSAPTNVTPNATNPSNN